MDEKQVDKYLDFIKANQHFEGLEMTNQELNDCSQILKGKVDPEAIKAQYIAAALSKKVIANG